MSLRATLELCLFRAPCSSRCLLHHLFKSEDKWGREKELPRESCGAQLQTPLQAPASCAQALAMLVGSKRCTMYIIWPYHCYSFGQTGARRGRKEKNELYSHQQKPQLGKDWLFPLMKGKARSCIPIHPSLITKIISNLADMLLSDQLKEI